jgi:hypothetical protein
MPALARPWWKKCQQMSSATTAELRCCRSRLRSHRQAAANTTNASASGTHMRLDSAASHSCTYVVLQNAKKSGANFNNPPILEEAAPRVEV